METRILKVFSEKYTHIAAELTTSRMGQKLYARAILNPNSCKYGTGVDISQVYPTQESTQPATCRRVLIG